MNAYGPSTPSIENWPKLDPVPITYTGKETMCGAFVDTDQKVKTYCLDPSSLNINKWISAPNLINGIELTSGDVNLTYTFYRNPDGDVLVGKPGRFLTSFNGVNDEEGSWTIASRSLDANNEPLNTLGSISKTRTRDEWSFTNRETAPIIYDHESLGGAKGIWLRQDDKDIEKIDIEFYRTGDGVLDGIYIDANDFHVMEAWLCRELLTNISTIYAENYCGSMSDTRHGY